MNMVMQLWARLGSVFCFEEDLFHTKKQINKNNNYYALQNLYTV